MANKQSKFEAMWSDIRRTSTPLVVGRTPDAAAFVGRLQDLMGHSALDDERDAPVLQWDAVRGLRPLNEPQGTMALGHALQQAQMQPEQTTSAVEALRALEFTPRLTTVFVLNAQAQWRQPEVVQAVWNLRDQFIVNRRTLVLVTPLGSSVPPEIEFDVVHLDEPMPDAEALAQLATREVANYGLTLTAEQATDAATAMCGLSAFTAGQALAMSARRSGVDTEALSGMRDEVIEKVPGLSVVRGRESLDDLAGVAVVKAHFLRLRNARRRARAVVIIDEGDKAFAGSGADGQMGDSNGLKGDQLGAILTEMDGARAEEQQDGTLFMGHPGTGKTAFARALAAALGVICIRLDLGALLNSFAGESQARVRQALAVIRAVSGGRALWVMTANSLTNLPAELRRRFDSQDMWFFDLPNAAERADIWRLYIRKYELEVKVGPASLGGKRTFDDTDWTGAEIRKACYRAWNTGVDLAEAAASIVPLAVSDAARVGQRRAEANGRFRSPSLAGAYRLPAGVSVQQVRGRDVALAAATIAATSGVKES